MTAHAKNKSQNEGLAQAAVAGDAVAQFHLAECYAAAWGVEKDLAMARHWMQAAAEQGHAEAAYRLATDPGLAESASVVAWLQRAADLEHGDAQAALGRCYHCGDGVVRDLAQACRYYRAAASNGSSAGRYNLALCYRDGIGFAPDAAQFIHYLKLAVTQGFARAQLLLGQLYAAGEHVSCDLSLARSYFEKAAMQNLAEAQYELGVLLRATPTKLARADARQWLERAAAQHYAKAQYVLAKDLHRGTYGNTDPTLALQYLHAAAERGYPKAQYRLAKRYATSGSGLSGEREYWRWLGRAAENGHRRAQYHLGKVLVSCPAEQRERARELLRRSAEGGDARAGYLLGHCFASGLGVPQDIERAYRWMYLAMRAGESRAPAYLKRLAREISAERVAAIERSVLQGEDSGS